MTSDRFFSYSMLRLFQQCERRYFYERVAKIQTPKGLPMVVGEVYHYALSVLVEGSTLPLGNIVADAIRRFEGPLKEVSANSDRLKEEMVTNLHRVLTLIGPFGFTPVEMPPGAEKKLAVEIKFLDPALGYAGVLDLLSKNAPITTEKGDVTSWRPGEPCVIDWKIISGDRRRTTRSATLSAQLALYALEAKVKFVGYVEIPRNPERKINVQVVPFFPEELEVWKKHLTSVRTTALCCRGDQKEAYTMTSRENGLCNPLYCPFWDHCYGK